MTPLHLEILLHAYAMAFPYTIKTETRREFIASLMHEGLLEPAQLDTLNQIGVGSILLTITERGKAYVGMLLATPLPVGAFVDPRTERVISTP